MEARRASAASRAGVRCPHREAPATRRASARSEQAARRPPTPSSTKTRSERSTLASTSRPSAIARRRRRGGTRREQITGCEDAAPPPPPAAPAAVTRWRSLLFPARAARASVSDGRPRASSPRGRRRGAGPIADSDRRFRASWNRVETDSNSSVPGAVSARPRRRRRFSGRPRRTPSRRLRRFHLEPDDDDGRAARLGVRRSRGARRRLILRGGFEEVSIRRRTNPGRKGFCLARKGERRRPRRPRRATRPLATRPPTRPPATRPPATRPRRLPAGASAPRPPRPSGRAAGEAPASRAGPRARRDRASGWRSTPTRQPLRDRRAGALVSAFRRASAIRAGARTRERAAFF